MAEMDDHQQSLAASYEKQFSRSGQMLNYAKVRCDRFWVRCVYSSVFSIAFYFWFQTLVPFVLLVCYVMIDALEYVYLRSLARRLNSGGDLKYPHILISIFALLNIAITLVFIALPRLHESGGTYADMSYAFFAMCLVVGPIFMSILEIRYVRSASLLRVGALSIAPISIVLFDMVFYNTSVDYTDVGLLWIGTVFFWASLTWVCIYVQQRKRRSRQYMKAQAEQQQALYDANSRLYSQTQDARRLALIAENANDSVMLLGRDNEILWANEAFTTMTGYTVEEALGRTPHDLFDPGEDPGHDASEIDLLRSKTDSEPFRMELKGRCKDGTIIWVDTNQVPVFDQNGVLESFIAVERNITKTKQHERDLEAARLAAEEGARVKDEFLATMSHEFRTPMNGVIGMAQLLQDTPLNPDQRLYIDTILSSSQALLGLINDVLDLSKIDANGVNLCDVEFDLRKCFEEAVRLLQIQAIEKGLSLSLVITENVPAHVCADDRRLRQVIVNLVGNAVKFTSQGRVDINVTIRERNGQTMLVFSVADTGIGIADEDRADIFDRFSQADAAISRRFGGTGLGLAISKRIAEAMGGDIVVTSELGVGSVFTAEVGISVVKANKHQEKEQQEPSSYDYSKLTGLRVLIAEDNAVNRLILNKFLLGCPIELEFATDGIEAVDIAQDFAPDMVFMDVSMPRKNGIEATRDIREKLSRQPFIAALTANVDEHSREACLAAGMDEFLTKPLARNKVLEILMQVAEKRARSEYEVSGNADDL